MAENEPLRMALEHYRQRKAEKLKEIQDLEQMIARLSRDLGEAAQEPKSEQETNDSGDTENGEVWRENGFGAASTRPMVNASVRPDAFFGMSYTTAAAAYLENVGHAVSMDELLDALNKGGAPVGGKEPKKTLYISLVRAVKTFVPIPGRSGFLGLRKFYPNLKAVKEGIDATAKAKKKKAKKKRKATSKGNGAKASPAPKTSAPTAHSPVSAKKDRPAVEQADQKGGSEK